MRKLTFYRPITFWAIIGLTFSFTLDGCVFNPPQHQGSTAEAEQYQQSPYQKLYISTINHSVAEQVRKIRVEQERTYFIIHSQSIELATGWCHAIVSLSPSGQVLNTEIKKCASPALERVERMAIHNAAPFPPLGHSVRVAINTLAPIALPGIAGR